jgi:hypothetical protein
MKVIAECARHRHRAALGRVTKLTVAALLSNLEPAVGLNLLDSVVHLHDHTTVAER